MKIIKAKNIGACFGVKNAIALTKKSLKEKNTQIQFLGSLVHNEKIIKKFIKKGVIFRQNLKEANSGILIIQAHGIPPFSQKINQKIIIKDATCPLVKKVQNLAKDLALKGYFIIIIGENNHSELKVIKGYVKNKNIVIENEDQAKKISLLKTKKFALICQTTQNLKDVNKILKILKNKNKNIKFFNTICPEIKIRQKEARKIGQAAKQILIVGSKSSANTKRLYQILKKMNKPIYWVNSLKQVKNLKLDKSFSVGLVSGTSADDLEIKKINNYLAKL